MVPMSLRPPNDLNALFVQRVILVVLVSIVMGLGCGQGHAADTSWIEYPAARRGNEVDVYHEVKVPDPYRWMEDEGSEETRAWLAAQSRIVEKFFDQLDVRTEVKVYLEENWIEGVIGVPVREGDRVFFWDAPVEGNHPILYVRKGDGEPEVVFDLNQNDPDGLRSTLPEITVSPKGRFVSYNIHYAGADAAETHFFDTKTNQKLDEVIPASYSWITDWLPDETGFFYTHLDIPGAPGQDIKRAPGVYRHAIGRPVEEDALVYGRPWEGMFWAAAMLAEDGEHLVIHDGNLMDQKGGWGVRSLEGGPNTEITWLIDPEPKHRFAYIDNKGSEVFLVTDYGAPNWRIVAANVEKPGIENLREVVSESEEPISMYGGSNYDQVVLHSGRLYVTYIEHNANAIRIFSLEGKPEGEIVLPFLGSVTSIATRDDDPVIYIGLRSFLVPHSVYAYDTETETLTAFKTVEVPTDFDNFEVTRVFYDSKDGTRVPMSIMKRKDTPLDGTAKVVLYGYGGWGIPLLPNFSNWHHAWLNLGGIYAVANLRGGGEYGEAWHEAGMFFNKQNVFDDFAAAAEYLVKEGYTTPSRLTIRGGSNGGLLTAACYNQRPELFGAVISQVAAVDMLRLPDTPIGATQTMELGAPKQSKEMFEYILGYSPLHNVRHEGPYPPILHMVGENDPRCKPGHIYKYVAETQRTKAPKRLSILRVVPGAGHGSARKAVNIAWAADEVAFAWEMTESMLSR
jgi:prolyl oligopeptidase